MIQKEEHSFQKWANEYDSHLNKGLKFTGEGKEYFALKRIKWIQQCIEHSSVKVEKIMDYGCGTGDSAPVLRSIWKEAKILGVDTCSSSIEKACKNIGSPVITFVLTKDYIPDETFDLVYTNGVFHHIKPANRKNALHFIYDSLAPGGVLAFWENNCLNPGTRIVMKNIPFDKDAIPLSSREARTLLTTSGFEVIRTDYLFFFPAILRSLRFLESFLTKIPLGGQYLILCKKPFSPIKECADT